MAIPKETDRLLLELPLRIIGSLLQAIPPLQGRSRSATAVNATCNIDSMSSDWSREGWMKVIPRGSRSASAVNVQCVTCRGGVCPPKAISRTCHPDKAQCRGISSTYFDSLSTGEGQGEALQGRGQPAQGLYRVLVHSDKAQRRGISSTYFDSLSTGEAP